jgi:GNAT superfamily N-acetyltransferase
VDVRPLSPSLVDDYLALFDAAFADNPYWAGCYCAYYDDPCPDDEWVADAGAAPAHRELKRTRIASGAAPGLLAFVDGRAVGWCNAGPRRAFVNLRVYGGAVDDPDEAVGSVMCFVVHPDHRRSGVASALLGATDGYFRSLGLDVAEAYPRENPPGNPAFPWTAAYYKGTPSMFAQAGYEPTRSLDGFTVMRKRLRPLARS